MSILKSSTYVSVQNKRNVFLISSRPNKTPLAYLQHAKYLPGCYITAVRVASRFILFKPRTAAEKIIFGCFTWSLSNYYAIDQSPLLPMTNRINIWERDLLLLNQYSLRFKSLASSHIVNTMSKNHAFYIPTNSV